MLGVQFGTDVVIADPAACFAFVSLEMSRWDIMTRIKCRFARMDWKGFVLGRGGARGNALFTEEELRRIDAAENRLKEIGHRILILDERNSPAPTLESALRQIEELKTRSGTSRAFVLVDYLQVLQPPEHVMRNLRTDIEADKWRIGQMKELRDSLGDRDAVFVISEARKPAGNSGDKWGGALADLMGSARTSYTPDMAFLFHPFTDHEFAEAFGLWKTDGKGDGKKIDKKAVDEVRERARGRGYAYNKFVIAKGRDGVRKDEIELTFWFEQSVFDEGVLPAYLQ